MFIQDANLKPISPLSYGNVPQYLILHHADMNGSVEDVDQVHKNQNFSMIGYNYYVRKDGSIWRGRPEAAIGANCYNYNAKSISICAEGNFMVDIMPEIQKQSIAILAKFIQSEYDSKLEIKGHGELYNTECPGINYPLDYIKSGQIETVKEVEKVNDFKVPDNNNVVPTGDNITPFKGFGWVETVDGRMIFHLSRVTYFELTSDGHFVITHMGQTRNI